MFTPHSALIGPAVFSSYESMAPTLSTAGQIAHSAEMFQRNYCADSIIDVYFGVAPYNQTKSSPRNFQVSAIRLFQNRALTVFSIATHCARASWILIAVPISCC